MKTVKVESKDGKWTRDEDRSEGRSDRYCRLTVGEMRIRKRDYELEQINGKKIDKREENKRKFEKNRNNKKLNGNKRRKINVVTCNR